MSGNDCTESGKSKCNKFMTISTGPLSKGEMYIAMIYINVHLLLTANPSGAHVSIPCFSWVRVTQYLG